MGEFYAVRVSGGKKEYYKTKADYHAGRARAQDSARKRAEREKANQKQIIFHLCLTALSKSSSKSLKKPTR